MRTELLLAVKRRDLFDESLLFVRDVARDLDLHADVGIATDRRVVQSDAAITRRGISVEVECLVRAQKSIKIFVEMVVQSMGYTDDTWAVVAVKSMVGRHVLDTPK